MSGMKRIANNGISKAKNIYAPDGIRAHVEMLCDIIYDGTSDFVDMRKVKIVDSFKHLLSAIWCTQQFR